MGLTCSDVEKFKFHSLLEISHEIDNVLGDRIPSDLVSHLNLLLMNFSCNF